MRLTYDHASIETKLNALFSKYEALTDSRTGLRLFDQGGKLPDGATKAAFENVLHDNSEDAFSDPAGKIMVVAGVNDKGKATYYMKRGEQRNENMFMEFNKLAPPNGKWGIEMAVRIIEKRIATWNYDNLCRRAGAPRLEMYDFALMRRVVKLASLANSKSDKAVVDVPPIYNLFFLKPQLATDEPIFPMDQVFPPQQALPNAATGESSDAAAAAAAAAMSTREQLRGFDKDTLFALVKQQCRSPNPGCIHCSAVDILRELDLAASAAAAEVVGSTQGSQLRGAGPLLYGAGCAPPVPVVMNRNAHSQLRGGNHRSPPRSGAGSAASAAVAAAATAAAAAAAAAAATSPGSMEGGTLNSARASPRGVKRKAGAFDLLTHAQVKLAKEGLTAAKPPPSKKTCTTKGDCALRGMPYPVGFGRCFCPTPTFEGISDGDLKLWLRGLHPTIWSTKKKAHERAAACLDVQRIRDAYGKMWPATLNLWQGYVISEDGKRVTMPDGKVFSGLACAVRAAYDEQQATNLSMLGNVSAGAMNAGIGGSSSGMGDGGAEGGIWDVLPGADHLSVQQWQSNGSNDILGSQTTKAAWNFGGFFGSR